MMTLKIALIAVFLVLLAVLALAIRIIFIKDGKFPETHISRNAEIKRRGIHCVKSMDRMEQSKIKHENRYKHLRVIR